MKNKAKKTAAQVWRIIKQHLTAVLFWAVVLWITAGLYAAASAQALLERGYKAVGGEAFIWLLPLASYAAKRWAVKEIKRLEPMDADYTPILEPVNFEVLTEATIQLSGVMAAVGVSAKDAMEAFRKFEAAQKETA